MKNFTNWISITLLGVAAVLWPFWLAKGYFDELYPLIGSFVGIYGGLIANIIFLVRQNKIDK